jgi:hypothetical protein
MGYCTNIMPDGKNNTHDGHKVLVSLHVSQLLLVEGANGEVSAPQVWCDGSTLPSRSLVAAPGFPLVAHEAAGQAEMLQLISPRVRACASPLSWI